VLVWLAKLSAKYPWTTVVVSILTAFSCITVGIFTNFQFEADAGILWTPGGSNIELHGDWLYSEESGFPLPSRPVEILVHANGKNILGFAATKRVFDVLDVVRFGTPGYDAVCSVSGDQDDKGCPISSPTAFWINHNRSLFESSIQTDEEAIYELSKLKFPNGAKVARSVIYGQAYPRLPESVENDDDIALLESVSVMRLKIDLPAENEQTRQFERDVVDNLSALKDEWDKIAGNEITIELLTRSSFDDELERGTNADIPYIALAFSVMGFFCAIVLAKWDKVKSQSLLGVGAVVTIVLAILTGYGLNFIIGTPFTPIVQIFPYVMVGIGLDDTFILTGEYGRTDRNKNVVDRVGDVMEKVGISVSVSTLTTFFAFLLGSVSNLPALKWFAYYAGPTVLIDFFYQDTFFLALIAIDDRRQKASRRDCCPCCIANRPTSDDDNTSEQEGEDKMTMITDDDQNQGKSDDRFSRLWESYISFLMRPVTKVVVLLFFGGLLVVGILGAIQQSQQFDFRLLLPNDSYVNTYYSIIDRYVEERTDAIANVACYFRNFDASEQERQQEMFNFIDDMVDLEYVSSEPAYNWLRDFDTYQNQTFQAGNTTFVDRLDVFLTTEPYKSLYQNDVIRNDAGFVTASRVYIRFDQVNAYDSKNQIDAYNDQIKIAEDQPSNADIAPKDWQIFSYGEIYKAWGLYDAVAKELILTVGLGIAVVFLIALIFIPHPIGAPIVAFIVAAIYTELLAVLWAADIYVNSVSALGLAMSMGLVVDYNMHMFLTYFEIEDCTTRDERVKKVLRTMGKSIFLGGFSTFLGILPLAFADSEFFRTFFFTFVGIVTLGPGHGLVFTPVVLSLIAPHTVKPTLAADVAEEEVVLSNKINIDQNNSYLYDSEEEDEFSA